MAILRSLLWIGPGARFEADLARECPTLDVVWERDTERALSLPPRSFDAALVDADDARTGMDAVRRLRRRASAPPCLVRVPAHEAACVPELLAAGAADVLLRDDAGGAADGELALRIERIAAGGGAPGRPAPPRRAPDPGIVGESPEMQAVFALLERASRSRATVLLTGETGTGKELIAHAIHNGSRHRSRPFVAVNCAAFPETLLESELFGHVRGAFTGADRDQKGLFEAADGGTLFLDEVSETSGPFQAKLLRVLQEREVRPVGGARSRKVDVRVVAATNRDPWTDVARGRFREDLYYRLAVFRVHVPPLRERKGDVRPLAEHFLAVHGRREGRPGHRVTADAARLLQAYAWPGNVRELENEIQRALALAEPGEPLTPAHFSERLLGILEPVEANAVGPHEPLRETLARIEAWLLRRALDANGGRRAETARRLGLTREGLYKKMKRLGVE